jgi:hypothetical protein
MRLTSSGFSCGAAWDLPGMTANSDVGMARNIRNGVLRSVWLYELMSRPGHPDYLAVTGRRGSPTPAG